MCELQADRAVDTNQNSSGDRENKIHHLLSSLWEKQARDKFSNLQQDSASLTAFFFLRFVHFFPVFFLLHKLLVYLVSHKAPQALHVI